MEVKGSHWSAKTDVMGDEVISAHYYGKTTMVYEDISTGDGKPLYTLAKIRDDEGGPEVNIYLQYGKRIG